MRHVEITALEIYFGFKDPPFDNVSVTQIKSEELQKVKIWWTNKYGCLVLLWWFTAAMNPGNMWLNPVLDFFFQDSSSQTL